MFCGECGAKLEKQSTDVKKYKCYVDSRRGFEIARIEYQGQKLDFDDDFALYDLEDAERPPCDFSAWPDSGCFFHLLDNEGNQLREIRLDPNGTNNEKISYKNEGTLFDEEHLGGKSYLYAAETLKGLCWETVAFTSKGDFDPSKLVVPFRISENEDGEFRLILPDEILYDGKRLEMLDCERESSEGFGQWLLTSEGEFKPVPDNDEETELETGETTMNKCPNCGAKVDANAAFCGECGEALNKENEAKPTFVAPYPKSQELHEKGGIGNKLVCSCGSKDFVKRFCYFAGRSSDGKYLTNEWIGFDYRCAKCGAEVYLSHEADGDFFCFVPKDKLAEARELVGVHEDESAFTKSFCYSAFWDDILPMPNFTDTYAFLRTALMKPMYVKFYLEKQPVDKPNADRICGMLENMEDAWEVDSYVDDNEDYDESKRGENLSKAKEAGKEYGFHFGPGISFAVDDAGGIVLNDNAHFVPDKEQMAECDFTKYERWQQVLQAYAEVNGEEDKYVGALSRAVNDSIAKEMRSSFELNGKKWGIVNLLAYVNFKALGGERMLIYRDTVWIQSKPLIGKATTASVKLDEKIDKMGFNEDDKWIRLGDETVSLRGPGSETIRKLFKALKLHVEYRKWFLQNK